MNRVMVTGVLLLAAGIFLAAPIVAHAGDPSAFDKARFLAAFGNHSRLHGLELERATFNDVQEVFGKADGFANSYGQTLCFVPEKNRAGAVVSFWAFREDYEPDDRINSFTVQSPAAPHDKAEIKSGQRSNCAASPLVTANIENSGGIRLGMSRESLLQLLGEPSADNGDSLRYEAEADASPPAEHRGLWQSDENRPWVVTSTLYLVFDGAGRLAMFSVSQVTTP